MVLNGPGQLPGLCGGRPAFAAQPENRRLAHFSRHHFVGYRHWTDHTLPRKRTVKRAKKTFKGLPGRYRAVEIDLDYICARVVSFTGYMAHCDSRRTLEHILDWLVLTLENTEETLRN